MPVDIWNVALDQSGDPSVLDADETGHAARLRTADHRRRYVAAHSAVRQILSRYAGAPAASLSIQRAPGGKPFLAGRPELRFNLTHSHERALLAVAVDIDVGVDLEYHRAMPDYERIAKRFFAPEESAEIAAIPEIERPAAFFRCWTRKEAFLKATGCGLRRPLDSFRVSLAATAPRLMSIDGDPARAADWSLFDLAQPLGYTASLAAATRHTCLAHFDWPLPR